MSRRSRSGGDETVADFDVRSPAARTIMTVLGTMLVVALVAGLILGWSILRKETKVTTSQVDVGQNSQLVINATSADLEIVEGEPDLLTITSSVTSGLRKTDYQLGQKGDEIKIVSNCQSWLNPGCGVKTRLQVPPGMPLVIRTTTGNVKASNLSGGVLNVRTADGRVDVSELAVDEFSAQTTAGPIDANFSKQPFGFKADSKSGDVKASIPDGELAYGVTTESSGGKVSSDWVTDEGAQGLIRVTTTSGDISLLKAPTPG